MSKFLTPLCVQELEDHSNDGRGTWQLLSDLVYQSDVAGRTFTAKAGFVTDFASVPSLIPIASGLLKDRAHQASVIHDEIYGAHEVEREMADKVLREAAIESGVPEWAAELLYAGVRLGGESHWGGPAQPQLPAVAATLAVPVEPGPVAPAKD